MWKYVDKKQTKDFLLSLNLIDCSDEKEYIKKLYSISNNVEKNYTIHKIPKKTGGYRKVYEPSSTLKYIQRKILNNILYDMKISKHAKAYTRNTSLVDNAKAHVNKKIILKLDIEDFFDNIEFMDIYNYCFPVELFPKNIGMLLTYLCTYLDYLPQGAPTSAYISNLVMRDFDDKVGYYCEKNKIDYTRYSDDMTFSGDFNPSIIIKYVKEELNKLSLRINYKKIHIINSSTRQSVTGIVVNEKVQVNKKYRDKIRQEIFYIDKYGLKSHLRKLKITDKDKYVNYLRGRINFVLQVNEYDLEFVKYKKYISSLI